MLYYLHNFSHKGDPNDRKDGSVMSILESVKAFCSYWEKNRAAAESLYAASKWFAEKHKSYSVGKDLLIDKTSETVMNNMLAKTCETPVLEQEDMRKKRQEAIDDFCYIYGGYIAFNLNKMADSKDYKTIPEHIKDEYIFQATTLVLDYISKKLNENGYSKGTFSHLVHKTISYKARDLFRNYERYLNDPQKNPTFVPITDDTEPIIGGIIEIETDNTGTKISDFDEDQLNATTILYLLKDVKTKHSADDYEMFYLRNIEGWKLEEIAKEFNLSVSTIHNRIEGFAKAALEQHEKTLKNLREKLYR